MTRGPIESAPRWRRALVITTSASFLLLGAPRAVAEEEPAPTTAPPTTEEVVAAPDVTAPDVTAPDVAAPDVIAPPEPAQQLADAAAAGVEDTVRLTAAAEHEEEPEGDDHHGGGAWPEGLEVLLNGVELRSGHASRVDSCAIEVSMTGVGGTEAVPAAIGVDVYAIPPTVAEGARTLVLSDDQVAVLDTWTGSYPMDELLAEHEIKTNGYRLAVALVVGAADLGERQLWLGCGAAQTGHPNRILVEKVWLDEAGQPITEPLDSVLPAGWRDDFEIVATSARGTAICTYPAGSDELTCVYDNPGHGSKPGLVVPNGKKHTYDVVELGLPDGWAVDEATVGTFFGRDTCDRGGGCGGGDEGGGGHDDEGGGCGTHEEPIAALAAAAGEDGQEGGGGSKPPCTHQVANRQLPAPPEPPKPPEPPTPPVVEPEVVPSVLPATQVRGITTTRAALPRTGAPVDRLLPLAGALLAAGALAGAAAARLRRAGPTAS